MREGRGGEEEWYCRHSPLMSIIRLICYNSGNSAESRRRSAGHSPWLHSATADSRVVQLHQTDARSPGGASQKQNKETLRGCASGDWRCVCEDADGGLKLTWRTGSVFHCCATLFNCEIKEAPLVHLSELIIIIIISGCGETFLVGYQDTVNHRYGHRKTGFALYERKSHTVVFNINLLWTDYKSVPTTCQTPLYIAPLDLILTGAF